MAEPHTRKHEIMAATPFPNVLIDIVVQYEEDVVYMVANKQIHRYSVDADTGVLYLVHHSRRPCSYDPVQTLCLSVDHRVLYSGHRSGKLRVYDVDTLKQTNEVQVKGVDNVNSICVAPAEWVGACGTHHQNLYCHVVAPLYDTVLPSTRFGSMIGLYNQHLLTMGVTSTRKWIICCQGQVCAFPEYSVTPRGAVHYRHATPVTAAALCDTLLIVATVTGEIHCIDTEALMVENDSIVCRGIALFANVHAMVVSSDKKFLYVAGEIATMGLGPIRLDIRVYSLVDFKLTDHWVVSDALLYDKQVSVLQVGRDSLYLYGTLVCDTDCALVRWDTVTHECTKLGACDGPWLVI